MLPGFPPTGGICGGKGGLLDLESVNFHRPKISGCPMICILKNALGGLPSGSSYFLQGAEASDDNVLKRA